MWKKYSLGAYNVDHPVIKMFWKVVESFTNKQKRQLLKFVTSCSRPPLLGFKVNMCQWRVHLYAHLESLRAMLPSYSCHMPVKNCCLQYMISCGAYNLLSSPLGQRSNWFVASLCMHHKLSYLRNCWRSIFQNICFLWAHFKAS